MIILGIETSCDETAAAVLQRKNGQIKILSSTVASSASLQAKYGGVIPEQAAREQVKSIIPVIEETLRQAMLAQGSPVGLDAIAVTQGPGLIGSLLVGVETAKTLSIVWEKPLIPVNHLLGHFYANWIETIPPSFPCIGLLVSGGHTDLVLFRDHGKYKYLGGTRDDASGECFDKCARLLGLSYPGGPEISKLARKGKDTFNFPRPMIDTEDFDFSFSGLKTAVANLIRDNIVIPANARLAKRAGIQLTKTRSKLDPRLRGDDRKHMADLAASIEAAIVDVLVTKTIRAAQSYDVEQIMVAGGVAANEKLVRNLKFKIKNLKLKARLFVPPPFLCTDNAAMIAAAGFFLPRQKAGQKPIKNPFNLQADPNLSLNPKT